MSKKLDFLQALKIYFQADILYQAGYPVSGKIVGRISGGHLSGQFSIRCNPNKNLIKTITTRYLFDGKILARAKKWLLEARKLLMTSYPLCRVSDAVFRIQSIFFGCGFSDLVFKIRIRIRVTPKSPDPDLGPSQICL